MGILPLPVVLPPKKNARLTGLAQIASMACNLGINEMHEGFKFKVG